MRYTILLEHLADGTYQASAPPILHGAVHGESRADALTAIRQALVFRLRDVELIELEIPTLSPTNPWLETAGMFANDPDLESITQEIYAARDTSRDS